MRSLPLLASLVVGALVIPGLLRSLRVAGLVRSNYRGAVVVFPTGVAIVGIALGTLIPLALLAELVEADVFRAGLGEALIYVVGVAMLGLLDDVAGGDESGRSRPAGRDRGGVGDGEPAVAPRGLRGHARATAAGQPSTGAVKALGTLGLALFVLSGDGRSAAEFLAAVALLALCTNFFNMLDLRPGRSIKALILLAAGLLIATRDLDPLWTLGLFVGPVLVLLPIDLRERGMLGDTGSNAVGAVAGLWLVMALSTTGHAVALAVLALATLYGEFRSISALIDRTPGLRQIDSLGRASHA